MSTTTKKVKNKMLIKCDEENYLKYIDDDPVRPNLFEDDFVRFRGNFCVYADVDKDEFGFTVNAIVCVAICPFLPQSEKQLRLYASGDMGEGLGIIEELLDEEDTRAGIVLCPYSLWSYKKGSGKRLINDLLESVPMLYPEVDHVITMSPPTKMAMKFHIGNGAVLLFPNEDTVNYEYAIPDDPIVIH